MPRASSSASTSANGCWRPLALMITARGCTTSSTSALVELSEPWCPAFSTSARSSPGAVAIHQPSSCCSASPGKSIVKSPRVRRTPTEQLLTSSPPSADRKSTRLNSSHLVISYAVFCLKKKNNLSCILDTSQVYDTLLTQHV